MIARRMFSTYMRTHTMKVGDYLERIKYQELLEPNDEFLACSISQSRVMLIAPEAQMHRSR